MNTMKYLGHIICPGILVNDDKRITRLRQLTLPLKCDQPQVLSHTVRFYWRFICAHKDVVALYTEYLLKEQPKELLIFSKIEKAAFDRLVQTVFSEPILALPRPSFPIIIDIDSDNHRLRAVLFQTNPHGKRKLIGVWSRSLNSHESSYPLPDKQFWQYFRQYRPFSRIFRARTLR